MAPADETSKHDASQIQDQIPLVLRAFPSPAVSNVSLDSPTLTKTLSCLASPGYGTPDPNPLETFDIMPTEPGASKDVPVMTPPAGQRRGSPDPTMNMIVGGALAPVHEPPPRPLSARAAPGLRLPSFQKLGIAAPHPDRYGQRCADGVWTDSVRARSLEGMEAVYAGSGEAMLAQATTTGAEQYDQCEHTSPKPTARPPNVPFGPFVHTLTPPAETGEPTWQPPTIGCSLASASMDSPATDPGNSTSFTAAGGDSAVAAATSAVQNVTISAPIITGERVWLDGAVQAVR